MKILIIGGATVDIIIRYEDAETMHLRTPHSTQSFLLLKEGGKVEVKEILYFSGGGANNATFSFKHLGLNATPCVKVGNDEAGTFILKKFKDAHINTDLIIVAKEAQTGTSFILPSLEGDRTILAFRGINALLTHQELPLSSIKKFDYVYITSLSGPSSQMLLPIVKEAHKHGIPVATNPGTSQLIAGAPTLREALPFIDILILNSYEAKKFMVSLAQTSETLKKKLHRKKPRLKKQCPELLQEAVSINDVWFSLNSFFKTVLASGPRVVVVTNGAEGVYVATHKTIYFHPSLPTTVVNTLGAGDAFGSCFVGSLVMGHSVQDALRHGIINAASVISHMDTKQGLLRMKELIRRAKALDQDLLHKISLR